MIKIFTTLLCHFLAINLLISNCCFALAPESLISLSNTQFTASDIDNSILEKIESIMREYDRMMQASEYESFYTEYKEPISQQINLLSSTAKTTLREGRATRHLKIREKLSDILGFLSVYAVAHKLHSVAQINEASRNLFDVAQASCNFGSFKRFIESSRNRLQAELSSATPKPIVFVMGHRNPDTDTVISSLFEAYRNQLLNPNVVYIPVLQGKRIPDEVCALLGDRSISESILMTDKESDGSLYSRAQQIEQTGWILVDHNACSFQERVASILDHHKPSEAVLGQDVAKTIEIVGSTAGLVAQRFCGMGIGLDQRMAKIVYGAALMDTENWSKSKTTGKDVLVMSEVKTRAGISEGEDRAVSTQFYQNLMSALLSTNDAELLFQRDYKEDKGFGFAVAKMKGVFTDQGVVADGKQSILDGMVESARANNGINGLPLTIVKVVDYREDNEKVRRERMYFVFSQDASPAFRKKTFDVLKGVLAEKNGVILQENEEFVDWNGIKKQLSRKDYLAACTDMPEMLVRPLVAPTSSKRQTTQQKDPSKASTEEYFYSEEKDLFVQRAPLKITDPGVKEAANSLGIKLWWDDEGRIAQISLTDTIRLFNKLGMEMMSPTDYWAILEEAYKKGDFEFVRDLLSKRYAEWLNVLYFKSDGKYYMIEHPTIDEHGVWQREKDAERIKEIKPPEGRYAWFEFPDLSDIFSVIDKKTGFPNPKSVRDERGKNTFTFKYWDVYTGLIDKMPLAAIRGRVTSSDTPSFDCGMPPDASDAKGLMVRPCRRNLLAPAIESSVFGKLKETVAQYDIAMKERKYSEFYEMHKNSVITLVDSLEPAVKEKLRNSTENSYIKIREKLADIIGFLSAYAMANDADAVGTMSRISRDVFNVDQSGCNFSGFKDFVRTSKERLRTAMDPSAPKPIVFVMGHRNPDTDTCISSLFEAYRNQLINPDVVCIPVVQGQRIPDEVRLLLNDDNMSNSILLTDEENDCLLYSQALNSGQANWILVDQNISPVQKYVISILDHHTPSDTALRQDVAKTIEIVGSTTGMVIQRFCGIGLRIDQEMARIAYGATLMDTENWSESKITGKDALIMDQTKETAGIAEDSRRESSTEFYQRLMSALLNTDDADLLFQRDYKEDWGFGFAVAKMKGVFDDDGNVSGEKQPILGKMVALARENNKAKNLPLTVVKVADYRDDNETVRQERMYFEFSDDASGAFKEAMFDLFETILRTQYTGRPLTLSKTEKYFDWSGVETQLSRKNVAPILMPVVTAFNEYFYSTATNKYVCRDFLKVHDRGVQAAAKRLGIELSADENGNVSYLSPADLMRLVGELGGAVLSPAEYNTVAREAGTRNDVQMQGSLESHEFIEILDMVVENYDPVNGMGKCYIHPVVAKTDGGYYVVSGELVDVGISFAEPGLINLRSVNSETGMPERVLLPGEDVSGEGSLSRYWSPRRDIRCVFTRGSIFIYRIPCLDGKVKFSERQASMGVRVVRSALTPPSIKTKAIDGHFIMEVDSYSGKKIYSDGILLPIHDITEEITQELSDVDPNTHTLDAFGYVNNMCPAEFLDANSNGNIGAVEIHYGPISYVREKNPLLLKGYRDCSLVDPDGCHIGWFIRDREDGKKDVVITDVRGRSKLMHQLYALRFLGLKDVSVYDYGFNFVGFAKKTIQRAMGGRRVKSFGVGKSIFERKLLRKIKYAEIYKEIRMDLASYKCASIKELLEKQIRDAHKAGFSEDDLRAFFDDSHVLKTLERMQSVIDENPYPDDFLIYWQRYGDAFEDYVRLIRTVNTSVIEITKFAKRLEVSPGLSRVILSEAGVVFYERDGEVQRVDLSDIIDVRDNSDGKKKDIYFKDHVTLEFLANAEFLDSCSELKNGLIAVFKFTKLFSGQLRQLKDYERLPDTDGIRERFNAKRIEKDVFDVHLLSRPIPGNFTERDVEPVARYPFGTFAADFAEGAQELGAKRYFHAGSCGVFYSDDEIEKWGLRRGDIIIPKAVYDKRGVLLQELNYRKMVESASSVLSRSEFPYRILMYNEHGVLVRMEGLAEDAGNPDDLINVIVTNHTSVDTPLEEDAEYVDFLKSKWMKSVDCETGKVVERMKQKSITLDCEFMFWVADVPGRKGEDLSHEKEYMPILEETRFRKAKGIMSDMYSYLRCKEERERRIDLSGYRDRISAPSKNLYDSLVRSGNAALVFLKGGNFGGLNPVLKGKILEKLDSLGLEAVEGAVQPVSFHDLFNRWGGGYFYWHFMKKIADDKKLSDSFVYQLKKCVEEKDEAGFDEWINEARRLALDDPVLAMALLVYDYYSSLGQYLLIKPKLGCSIDTGEMTFQEYVKRRVVGETYAYRAAEDQLRHVVKGELEEDGSARGIFDRAKQISPDIDEEFLSSIFNAIHCPGRKYDDRTDELFLECISIQDGDALKFEGITSNRSNSVDASRQNRSFSLASLSSEESV